MFSLRKIDVFNVSGLPQNNQKIYKNDDAKKGGLLMEKKRIWGGFWWPLASISAPFWSRLKQNSAPMSHFLAIFFLAIF